MKFTPRVEALDDRALMSVTLTNGLLEVVGTTGADQIRVTLASPTTLEVTVDSTGESQQFDLSAVSKILVRALAGDDTIVVGPSITIAAEVRAWAGNDTVLGGGGNDKLLGGGGNDRVEGRGGSDEIRGQAGNDYLMGQGGDDYLDGLAGDDLLLGGSGNNTFVSGTNLDLAFSAPLPGGVGSVSLSDDTPGNPFAKTFSVSASGIPNVSADVFVGTTLLGHLSTNSAGVGTFVYHINFDANSDGVPDILQGAPSPLPELAPTTVITANITSPFPTTISATIAELLAQVGQ